MHNTNQYTGVGLSGDKTKTWQECAAQCETQGRPSFSFSTSGTNVGDCACAYGADLSYASSAGQFMLGYKGGVTNGYDWNARNGNFLQYTQYNCVPGGAAATLCINHRLTEPDYLYNKASMTDYKSFVDNYA